MEIHPLPWENHLITQDTVFVNQAELEESHS